MERAKTPRAVSIIRVGRVDFGQMWTGGTSGIIRKTESNLSKDDEGLAALRTKAKDGEVVIQGCGALDTQPAHYREARAINNGKILVVPGDSNLPGSFQVGQTNRLNGRNSASHSLPKPLRGIALEPVAQQGPRLGQDVIGSD